MTTTKIENISITATGSKGSSAFSYDVTSKLQSGILEIKWAGGIIKFATIADYNQFLLELIKPTSDLINSTSGTGIGYSAMTLGIAGDDAIHN